jgi:hypothetical protein
VRTQVLGAPTCAKDCICSFTPGPDRTLLRDVQIEFAGFQLVSAGWFLVGLVDVPTTLLIICLPTYGYQLFVYVHGAP